MATSDGDKSKDALLPNKELTRDLVLGFAPYAQWPLNLACELLAGNIPSDRMINLLKSIWRGGNLDGTWRIPSLKKEEIDTLELECASSKAGEYCIAITSHIKTYLLNATHARLEYPAKFFYLVTPSIVCEWAYKNIGPKRLHSVFKDRDVIDVIFKGSPPLVVQKYLQELDKNKIGDDNNGQQLNSIISSPEQLKDDERKILLLLYNADKIMNKTQLVYKTNLSDTPFRNVVNSLLKNNYIERRGERNKYLISPKGKKTVETNAVLKSEAKELKNSSKP